MLAYLKLFTLIFKFIRIYKDCRSLKSDADIKIIFVMFSLCGFHIKFQG